MPLIRLAGFDGLVPRTSATMLADNQAQQADNVKLYGRELRQWHGPTEVEDSEVANARTIYKMYGASGPIWLGWTTDVDVVRGPLADDDDNRIYFTGDGYPKKTYYALAYAGGPPYPAATRRMGVPNPVGAPSATISGTAPTIMLDVTSSAVANDSGTVRSSMPFSETGTSGPDTVSYTTGTNTITVTIGSSVDTAEVGSIGVTPDQPVVTNLPSTSALSSTTRAVERTLEVETRAYVYTYVSTFGSVTEESGPSPASPLVDVIQGQSVTVSGFSTPPTSGYNITAIRVYRTVTGAQTDSYQFVAEVPYNASSYVDVLSVEQLGEVLRTVGWSPPPDTLAGLVSHPSGALVGFSGNTLYFSEPFYPHAWPLGYSLTLPYSIVSIGVFGNSLVVATDKYPYVVSGPYPGAMSVERLPLAEPCVSKRSLVSDEQGVIYASPNGLVAIGNSLAQVVTTNLFRRDEWELEEPELMQAVIYDNKYVAIRPDSLVHTRAMVISRDDIPALSRLDLAGTCTFVDDQLAELYYADEAGLIYQADSDLLRPYTYEWKSKRFVLPQGTTFSAFKVDADYDETLTDDEYNDYVAAIAAANVTAFASDIEGAVNANTFNEFTLNGSTMQDVPAQASARTVNVTIYGDGVERATYTMTSFDPVRIPPFRSRDLEFRISGNVIVRSLIAATTVPELRAAE